MASSHTGTSTHNTLGGQYQVFLSFCGSDSRRGFANSVYHALSNAGINVFIDEERLEPGERISSNLLRAIDDSKIYMPIFSKRYASRHWCLRELAMMVENTSKSKEDGDEKVILPIFYNVSVEDVKLNTRVYKDAISKLEQMTMDQRKKFDSVDIARWRQALKNVCGFSGFELKNYRGDGHLSDSVVEEVVRKLQARQRKVTEDLVGMEDRIADINNLLDMESGDVRLIGLCGMGGMGKTTLAKVIFNQLCPHFGKNCSFLDDVKERAKTKGLIELQKQLLSDISYPREIVNIDDGIKAIGDTICRKKVLIVLDDVDDITQIRNLIEVKSFYSGTRILITTRDKNVLNIRRFKFEEYEMVGLSDKDALQLFSRHAFDVDSPPLDYFTLSEDIVSTTGGLPLALEAIGASLFQQKERKIWEEVLEELRKIPHDNVLGLLQITYDALKPGQQQIFLDIACLFIGYDKTNPIYMWKDCGFGPEYAISVLKNRCMIKVLDNNEFWMHDQFRDLGRAISNRERSRLWARDDVIRELRSTEINTSVQALVCYDWAFNNHTTVTPEQIKRFPHLRLLWLRGITFQGNFTGYLSELKWIDLYEEAEDYDRFTATNLNPENVVVMAISGCMWREDAVISLVEGAKKLKALTLAHILPLHRTPTFSEDSVLERLTFNSCYRLKEIDCSIKKLRCLTDLTVEDSWALQKLPEEIGELKHLQHLSLKKCLNLRELPDSVSKLKSLTKLDVSGTFITRLPDSIGTLQSLSSLDLSYTTIVKLPGTMSNLSQLHTLDLRNSDIQELPKLPESLTTLRLISSSLQTVPNLSNLTNLVELLLSDYPSNYKHSNIIQPCDLPWIRGLSKLRKLHLRLLNVHATSTDWASLTLLEELTLEGLDLQTLKQLPSNLGVLRLDNTRVKQVELDRLPQLKELTISRCELITRISITSSLRELRVVGVSSCNNLVEVQFLGVLKSMEKLYITGCESLGRLVCLSEETGCNELQATELSDDSRRVSLVSSSLKTLQELQLSNCPGIKKIQFVSALESLKEFVVQKCISLKRLGGLSNLKNLKGLEIDECESLQVVEGIDELEHLEQLTVDRCRSMRKIIDASSSKVPKECEISMIACGEVPDTGPYGECISWECYREKILNAPTQAPDSDIETTFSEWETETGDPLSEEQDDGDKDDNNSEEDNGWEDDDDEDNEDDSNDDDDDDDGVHEDHEKDDSEDDEVDDVHSFSMPSLVCSVDDNDSNDDVDEEGKGKANGNSNSKDGEDEDEDNDNDKYSNVHEVLQSYHGTPLVSSLGDNDESNDVAEEGKGKGDADSDEDRIRTRKRGTMKKLKRRGFCSCLVGLCMFIPWIITGNNKKEEESDDEEAEKEVRDGTE